MAENKPKYDLEERVERFARDCRDYVKKLPRTISNIEYSKTSSKVLTSIEKK